jgi:hypothetical protein
MKVKLVDENLVGQPGLCPFIDPGTGWQRDLSDYDACIYTDRLSLTQPVDSNKLNCAWIIEPPIINGENYRDIVQASSKYKFVFSYLRDLETKISNFRYIPHGGTWLRSDEINIYPKTKLLSFLFSDKQWNSYHRLRHRLYEMLKDQPNIDFYGSGCGNRILYKIDSLKDYYFSIIVENSQEDDYFTEKLLDCLLTGTVPIYIGSNRIENYFNTNSIIRFNDPEQLPSIISSLTPEYYESLLDSIRDNYEKAKQYIHPEQIIQQCLTTL